MMKGKMKGRWRQLPRWGWGWRSRERGIKSEGIDSCDDVFDEQTDMGRKRENTPEQGHAGLTARLTRRAAACLLCNMFGHCSLGCREGGGRGERGGRADKGGNEGAQKMMNRRRRKGGTDRKIRDKN